jgi:hypothetical protein
MSDKRKIYGYIKRTINPYGRPFEGTAYEFGLKIMDFIENIDDEKENGWIPVSERLPAVDGMYTTTLSGELVGTDEPFVGQLYFEDGYWEEDGDCVIAWMPLPEPYKREGEKHNETD